MRAAPWAMAAIVALCGCGPGSALEAGEARPVLGIEDGARLSSPRATHALVRLADGRMLAIGGCVAAGCEAGPASATLDIIAADGRRTIGTGRLLQPRVQPSAIALADGTVFILGGWIDGRVSAATEIFDPATGRSRAGPQLPEALAMPTLAALPDGNVLIAGGNNGRRVVAGAHRFDPRSGTLVRLGNLNVARAGATGTRLPDGRVLIAGGGDSESRNRHALASAELFDPATGSFAATGSLRDRRYKHGAVALPSGDVLIVGGSDERDYEGKLRSIERYDPATGRFTNAGNLIAPRFKLADALVLLGTGQLVVAGGDEYPEIFDPGTRKSLRLATSLGGQWNYLTALAAANGSVFLAGGYSEGSIEPTARTWLLTPATS